VKKRTGEDPTWFANIDVPFGKPKYEDLGIIPVNGDGKFLLMPEFVYNTMQTIGKVYQDENGSFCFSTKRIPIVNITQPSYWQHIIKLMNLNAITGKRIF
jgi:hypothetical protein